MRILQMIDLLTTGGAQKLLVTFAQQAKLRGIDTDVLCLEAEEYSPVGREIQELGVTVTYLPAPHLLDLKRLFAIGKYLKKNPPDIIQTHLLYANVIGGITGFFAGIPVIATVHSTDPDSRIPKGYDWLEMQIMNHLDRRVIAYGYKAAEVHHVKLGKTKVDVAPYGVNLPAKITDQKRIQIRRTLVGDEARLILITVGRFSYPKAFNDLLEAFVTIRSRLPQAVLVLVGDGDLRNDLEQLTHSLGLDGSVVFTGIRDDIPQLLAGSDLFICSSIFEGGPLVVMEAMIAGLPVVSTSVGDVPYFLKPDCGVIVPPGQPLQLANASIDLLENTDKRKAMGAAGQKYAMVNLTSSNWADKLESIYSELI
jgi:L-malate glycosyltransferase